MPIRKSDAQNLLKEFVREIHGKLDGHFDFLSKIEAEDDWSFVIKAHALIEAAITQLLIDSVADERLKRVFERLPLSDKEVGKIAAAKELGHLTKEQRRFIRFFSSLRNNLVHRVENIGFRFSSHIDAMNADQRQLWQESIVWFCQTKEVRAAWHELALTQPRITLWLSVFMLIADCSITSSELRGSKSIKDLALKTSEELLKNLIAK